MKELKIIITKGLQGSGKSSWAEEFIKVNQNYKRVNRDLFRQMLSAYTYNDENEKLVTMFEQDAVISLIETGKYNIIIDAMHLNNKYIEAWKHNVKDWIKGYYDAVSFTIKEFPIYLSEAIERDAKRTAPIGAKVLKDTWRRYEIELKQMIERAKPKYPYDPNLPDAVIFDLDGTLFLNNHRKAFDLTKVIDDELNEVVAEQLTLHRFKRRSIIFMSGREDICKEDTIKSIKKNGLPYDELYMRKAKDMRQDAIVKQELFDEHIRGKYNVVCVYDDRPQVIRKWKELGLFVFNVGDGIEF